MSREFQGLADAYEAEAELFDAKAEATARPAFQAFYERQAEWCRSQAKLMVNQHWRAEKPDTAVATEEPTADDLAAKLQLYAQAQYPEDYALEGLILEVREALDEEQR